MCRAASFVVTKDKVYWSETIDSHEDIIKECNLHEGDRINFVRVEIVPPYGNYRLPISKWEFVVDQDIIPDWFDKKEQEVRCRKALKDWYKVHVIKDGRHYLTGNISRIILGGEVEIDGQKGGICQFYDSSKGTISNQKGGICQFYDSSKGTVSNQIGGDCKFYDSSRGTVSNQSGGYCEFNSSSKGTVSGQIGGICKFHNSSKGTVSDQSGGYCAFYDSSKKVEV